MVRAKSCGMRVDVADHGQIDHVEQTAPLLGGTRPDCSRPRPPTHPPHIVPTQVRAHVTHWRWTTRTHVETGPEFLPIISRVPSGGGAVGSDPDAARRAGCLPAGAGRDPREPVLPPQSTAGSWMGYRFEASAEKDPRPHRSQGQHRLAGRLNPPPATAMARLAATLPRPCCTVGTTARRWTWPSVWPTWMKSATPRKAVAAGDAAASTVGSGETEGSKRGISPIIGAFSTPSGQCV